MRIIFVLNVIRNDKLIKKKNSNERGSTNIKFFFYDNDQDPLLNISLRRYLRDEGEFEDIYNCQLLIKTRDHLVISVYLLLLVIVIIYKMYD